MKRCLSQYYNGSLKMLCYGVGIDDTEYCINTIGQPFSICTDRRSRELLSDGPRLTQEKGLESLPTRIPPPAKSHTSYTAPIRLARGEGGGGLGLGSLPNGSPADRNLLTRMRLSLVRNEDMEGRGRRLLLGMGCNSLHHERR